MKLNIRSVIGTKLNHILQNKKNKKYIFRIGSCTRDRFYPTSSEWIKHCICSGLTPSQRIKVGKFTNVCEVGYVNGFWLVLGHLDSEEKTDAIVYTHNNCNIQITHDCIQIELTESVTNLKELFDPVKLIFGLIKPLFKSNTKITLPPRMKIKNTKLIDKTLGIMPSYRSELCVMILEGTSVYLVINSTVHELHFTSSRSVGKTVLEGEWYNQTFSVYDCSLSDGEDITNHTLIYRRALAKRMIVGTKLCTMAPLYSTYTDKLFTKMVDNGGVLFTSPQRKHSENSFLYRLPTDIGFVFRISACGEEGFQLFELLLPDGSVFKGNNTFPYNSPIPLTRDDRDFIQQFPTSLFEFRWYNDNFIPYSHVEDVIFNVRINDWPHLHEALTTFKNTTSSAKVLMIAQQKNPLKMLSVNKSVVFYSPVEGDDVLVRTGTIGEGSCLFHALLHAYSKDYAVMDRKGRMTFVRRLRASMAGKVDIESWEEMGGGLISKIPFQENVHDILFNMYKFINGEPARGRSTRRVLKKLFNDKDPDNLYKIVIELMPFDELSSVCLPKAYDRTQEEKIEKTNEIIAEEIVTFLLNKPEISSVGTEKAEYIIKKVLVMIETVLAEAKESAYRSYIKGLERVSEEVDTYTIEFISERFDRDVYFIDGTSRLPYNNCPTTKNIKGRKTMFVLWVGGNHYEIIGRLLPGNRVQREFPHDDELVNRVKTFLMKPESIGELYPELTEFLPKQYRGESPKRRQRTTRSSTPVDSDSDAYYDSSDGDSVSENEN